MEYRAAYIGNGLFQINNEDTPVDEMTLGTLIQSGGLNEIQANMVIEEIKALGSKEFEVTSGKGVIVDLYEVDYPTPPDPLKETQDLASHLDEKQDFVTQYLFPGTETEDVVVGLRSDLFPTKVEQHPSRPPLKTTVRGINTQFIKQSREELSLKSGVQPGRDLTWREIFLRNLDGICLDERP